MVFSLKNMSIWFGLAVCFASMQAAKNVSFSLDSSVFDLSNVSIELNMTAKNAANSLIKKHFKNTQLKPEDIEIVFAAIDEDEEEDDDDKDIVSLLVVNAKNNALWSMTISALVEKLKSENKKNKCIYFIRKCGSNFIMK